MQSPNPPDASSGSVQRTQRESARPLLDTAVTLSRFAGDETLLAEVAAVFVRTVPQLMMSISDAVTASDLKHAFLHAHSLKGAVAAFEAPAVLSAVLALETHAKNNDPAATAAAWPAAHALAERLLGELAQIIPSDGGAPAAK